MKVRRAIQLCERAVMLSIFALVTIEIFDTIMAGIGSFCTISDYGNYHLVYWFPLTRSASLMVVALFFLWWCYKLKFCALSRIACWLYSGLCLNSLIFAIFVFKWHLYVNIYIYILTLGLLCVLIIYFVRRWKVRG